MRKVSVVIFICFFWLNEGIDGGDIVLDVGSECGGDRVVLFGEIS